MKRVVVTLFAVSAIYVSTGFYVVRGNEKAAVRRFGRAVRTSQGVVALAASGLHYTLPWPFATVDRVKLNEVRTLALDAGDLDEGAAPGFLRSLAAVNRSQFLTGDKNVLHVQVNTQYHVSEEYVGDYLFGAESSERQLERLVESLVTDLISRSGVDFVHPLGQVELNGRLTDGIRRLADSQRIGLEIDDVTINAVYPPLVVKSYFLDVTNARADKINFVNEANAYAEQRAAAARAACRRALDEAASYRHQTIESARASADSFTRMVQQFGDEERAGAHSYAEARQMTLRRSYVETLRDVLRSVSAKILLESGETADITLFGQPSSGDRRSSK
jgi:membrane protease subunit HflK